MKKRPTAQKSVIEESVVLTVFAEDAMFPEGTETEETTARMLDAAAARVARVVRTHRSIAVFANPPVTTTQ